MSTTASERIRAAAIAADDSRVGEFRRWLRTSEAHGLLDDAVLGCLSRWYVDELLDDFGISADDFRRELNAALAEGN